MLSTTGFVIPVPGISCVLSLPGNLFESADDLESRDTSGYEMLIRANDAGDRPGALVARMVNPASFSANSLNLWTPPAHGLALQPDTTYWVEVGKPGDVSYAGGVQGALPRFITQSGSEDPTNDSSWSIDDDSYMTSASQPGHWVEYDDGRVPMIEIKGTARTAPIAGESTGSASGSPTITGTPRVAEVLTADTSDISDPDGMSNVDEQVSGYAFQYQWQRVDANTEVATDITEGFGRTYLAKLEDEGYKLRVKVWYTDDNDVRKGPFTSAPTEVVAETSCSDGNELSELTSLTVQAVGGELTSFSPDFSSSEKDYTAWMSHGATGVDYTAAARHGDAHLRYDISSREEDAYRGEPVYSDRARIRVANYRDGDCHRSVYGVTTYTPKHTGLVVRGDTVTEGTDRSLSFEVILRPASDEQVTVEYATSDGTATAAEDYTAVSGELTFDAGDTMQVVSVPVMSDEVLEGDETVTLTLSNPSGAEIGHGTGTGVIKDANIPATGAPTISGTAQVGETLTADTSGISDDNGLTDVSYGYQWVRNDGTDDADISGATGSAYTLVDADEGNTIKLRVNFTDDAGFDEESLTSAATGTVAARPNSAATGAPTVSGPGWAGH